MTVDRGSTGVDRGSATLWALLIVVVLWAAAGLAVVETAAVGVRHRADAVADAAALAGAADGGIHPTKACRAARVAAGQHSARLLACVVAGPLVTVEVALDPPSVLVWAGPARAWARAGPANSGTWGEYSQVRTGRNLVTSTSLAKMSRLRQR